jgi:hypothetical protein
MWRSHSTTRRSACAYGQGPRQDAVDDAEDRAGGADAERKGHDRDRREPRVAPQKSGGVAQIEDEILERPDAARVPGVLLEGLDPAEIAHGPPAGLVRRHALPDVLRVSQSM